MEGASYFYFSGARYHVLDDGDLCVEWSIKFRIWLRFFWIRDKIAEIEVPGNPVGITPELHIARYVFDGCVGMCGEVIEAVIDVVLGGFCWLGLVFGY